MTASCSLPLLPLTSSGLLGCSCPHGLSSLPHPGGQCSGPSASPDAFPEDPGLPWWWLPFWLGPVCKLRAVPGEEARSQPQCPGLPGQPASCPLGDWLDMTGTAKQPTRFHKDRAGGGGETLQTGGNQEIFFPFFNEKTSHLGLLTDTQSWFSQGKAASFGGFVLHIYGHQVHRII